MILYGLQTIIIPGGVPIASDTDAASRSLLKVTQLTETRIENHQCKVSEHYLKIQLKL